MIAIANRRPVSINEYYRLEGTSDFRFDYFDGEIVEYEGASTRHSALVTDLGAVLGGQLKKSKRGQLFTGGLRIRVLNSSCRFHPDVSVFCGDLEYEEEEKSPQRHTATNPTALFEVCSTDGREKWHNAQLIESLRSYVQMWRDEPIAEIYERTAETDVWRYRNVCGLDSNLEIESIKISIPLREIYERALELPDR